GGDVDRPRGGAPRSVTGLAGGQLGNAGVLRGLLDGFLVAGEDPAGQHRAAGRGANRLGDRGQQAHVLGDEQQAGVGAELAGAERQRAGVPGGDRGRAPGGPTPPRAAPRGGPPERRPPKSGVGPGRPAALRPRPTPPLVDPVNPAAATAGWRSSLSPACTPWTRPNAPEGAPADA